jgi:hypothetical protein
MAATPRLAEPASVDPFRLPRPTPDRPTRRCDEEDRSANGEEHEHPHRPSSGVTLKMTTPIATTDTHPHGGDSPRKP